MIYIKLFLSFFKIGLFTIGGGLAALPLLQEAAISNNWVSSEDFFHMVAVSESTPGPIGINMATYVGFETAGLIGGCIATLGMVMPSLIIIILIAKYFMHFHEKKIVQAGFLGLRPAVTGLIATAAFQVLTITLIQVPENFTLKDLGNITIDYKAIILFIIISLGFYKLKWHPIIFILLGAIAGIFLF